MCRPSLSLSMHAFSYWYIFIPKAIYVSTISANSLLLTHIFCFISTLVAGCSFIIIQVWLIFSVRKQRILFPKISNCSFIRQKDTVKNKHRYVVCHYLMAALNALMVCTKMVLWHENPLGKKYLVDFAGLFISSFITLPASLYFLMQFLLFLPSFSSLCHQYC